MAQLLGWLPAGEARASAVMVHGFDMNKSHMLSRAKVLLEAGVNVALVDLRARGESGGELTSPGPPAAGDVTPCRISFRATVRRGWSWIASYTAPMPPAPISRTSS